MARGDNDMESLDDLDVGMETASEAGDEDAMMEAESAAPRGGSRKSSGARGAMKRKTSAGRSRKSAGSRKSTRGGARKSTGGRKKTSGSRARKTTGRRKTTARKTTRGGARKRAGSSRKRR